LSPQAFAIVCALIFGLNIGSFLNVVIWRLPRGGSIAEPKWSYCPRCEHRLGALDLIPVLSFLFLGRRCRYCKEPISWRYPAIELLTGILFMIVAYRFGLSIDTVFYCLFAAALICVFFIDLEHFIIPDGLNITAAVIGFAHNGVAYALGQPGQIFRFRGIHLPASLVGFVVYAAVIYAIGLASYVVIVSVLDRRKNFFVAGWEYISDNVQDWVWITVDYASRVIPPLRRFVPPPEPLEGFTAEEIESDEDAGGMGGGDGKLAAAIGANLYVVLALQSALLAVFLGAFIGVIVMIRQRRRLGGRTAMPFGPSMAVGAFIALMLGSQITQGWRAYVRMMSPPVATSTQSAPNTSVPVSPHG
jgi:leader peptidase (prepilin peptidase)/N-methyltransferase